MNWSSFTDWGSLTSLIGLGVAGVGLIVVGYQATGAKRAANQARKAIADVLTFGSGNRATTLVQELKNVLHKGQWEVGYHQCHTLRTLIGDLKMTGISLEHIQLIDEAVVSLTDIENDLDAGIRKEREPKGADDFNASLSDIQVTLESILSKAASSRGGSHG